MGHKRKNVEKAGIKKKKAEHDIYSHFIATASEEAIEPTVADQLTDEWQYEVY